MPNKSKAESFDSILVRLKAKHTLARITEEKTFRFHTGSIKRLSC